MKRGDCFAEFTLSDANVFAMTVEIREVLIINIRKMKCTPKIRSN
jgi:hypothetical protein